MRTALVCVFCTSALAAWPGVAPTQTRDTVRHTMVVVLGSGTPNADPDHSGPAVAVVVNGRAYLVDAGPGVVRRAAAAARDETTAALRAPNLDVVFLTHLHSDHTVGLPDLMLSPWVLGRSRPLRVYGPPGTTSMVRHLSMAYAEDVHVRRTGGEPSNATGFRSDAFDVKPGIVFRDSNVTVTAFEVPHGSWKHSYAYRFDTADRSVVVSGDTGPTDEVARACARCDVLVYEVYSAARFAGLSPAWKNYHSRFHTSSLEVGDIAARARPGLLVLYHQLFWGDSDDDLVRQVKSRYDGPVVSARDLGVY